MIGKSDQISNLAAAILEAQKDIGAALKSSKNPYFKSKYADLTVVIDAVKEPLNKHGIAFLQAVDANGEGSPVIDTILLHSSGQYLSTRTPVFCSKPNDPQAFGSGVTYSKRYALQAILGLPTEDDDAERAMARDNKQADKPKFGPPAKQPMMTKKSEEIVEQAFFDYETVQGGNIAKGFVLDLDKFKDAVYAMHNKWPTQKDSVAKIVEAVELKDVIKELEPQAA